MLEHSIMRINENIVLQHFALHEKEHFQIRDFCFCIRN